VPIELILTLTKQISKHQQLLFGRKITQASSGRERPMYRNEIELNIELYLKVDFQGTMWVYNSDG